MEEYRCFVADEYKDTRWPEVLYLVLWLVYVICLVSFVVLYSMIGFQAYKYRRRIRGQRSASIKESVHGNSENDKDVNQPDRVGSRKQNQEHDPDESGGSCPKDNCEIEMKDLEKDHQPYVSDKQSFKIQQAVKAVAKKPGYLTQSSMNWRKSFSSIVIGRRKIMSKTTKILCAISCVYVVTYLPLLSLMVMKYETNMEDEMSEAHKYLYYFFSHCIYMGCLTNSLIYSIFDSNFRAQCRKICRGR